MYFSSLKPLSVKSNNRIFTIFIFMRFFYAQAFIYIDIIFICKRIFSAKNNLISCKALFRFLFQFLLKRIVKQKQQKQLCLFSKNDMHHNPSKISFKALFKLSDSILYVFSFKENEKIFNSVEILFDTILFIQCSSSNLSRY